MSQMYPETRKTLEKSNVGQKWTKEQEDNVLNDLKTMNVPDIAKKYKRTIGGINCRLRVIAAQMMNAGKSIQEVSETTKLIHSEIELACKKYNDKINKSKDDSGKSTESHIEVLMDIRDILLRINAKLEKICNKLC